MQQISIGSIVHKHAIADASYELGPICKAKRCESHVQHPQTFRTNLA